MTIADKIKRAKADIDAVYESGKTAGREIEYREFWEKVYPNLDRVDGTAGFPGRCWNNETFKPPQIITIYGNCSYCFFNSGITDISDKVEFSDLTSCANMFQYCRTQVIGELDFSKLTNKTLQRTFDSDRIVTIQLLTVGEDVVFSNTFANCKNLVNLTVAGTIGKNGLNLQWSTKLSKESITSLINALSTTASGLAVTLSATAVNTAFSAEEWTALANTRTNWTISLV